MPREESEFLLVGVDELAGKLVGEAMLEISDNNAEKIAARVITPSLPLDNWSLIYSSQSKLLSAPYNFFPICIRDKFSRGLGQLDEIKACKVVQMTRGMFCNYFKSSYIKEIVMCFSTYEFYGSEMGMELTRLAVESGKIVICLIYQVAPSMALHGKKMLEHDKVMKWSLNYSQKLHLIYINDLNERYSYITNDTLDVSFGKIEREHINILKDLLVNIIGKY